MLAWFLMKEVLSRTFKYAYGFQNGGLNLVPGPNNTKSALAVKTITTECNNGFPWNFQKMFLKLNLNQNKSLVWSSY